MDNEPIRVEILSYSPGDDRFDTVSVELGQASPTYRSRNTS